MKLVCGQEQLNQNLNLISRAVATRPTHPILSNILVEATDDGFMTLTAYDLDLGIVSRFPAEVAVPGRTTLPAKYLSDIVSKLPAKAPITFAMKGDDLVMLECGFSEYQVRAMDPVDFPAIPQLPEADSFHLEVQDLLQGLDFTLFSASADETKQVLTGVHIKTAKDNSEFAATDGHRLAVVRTNPVAANGNKTAPTLDVTIPVRALRELQKMLSAHTAETVEVSLDRGQVIFQLPDQRLTTRLLDGQYPNYGQLIPESFIRNADLERKSFLNALERISVLADQKNHIVRMDFASTGILTLSVDAPDVGSGREQLEIRYTGEDLTIAFNVKYLLEGLRVIQASDIKLQFNGPVNPAVLKPIDGSDFSYLVMPVHLRT